MTVTAPRGLEDLREVISAYNALAERLQTNQQALERQVAGLREELAEKNRQLARKNRLEVLGEMAAGVAHEIRNPLGSIELYAGLIARESPENDKAAAWAKKILRATRDLSRIVGEILDFTRPLKPKARPIQIAEAVDAALELASSALDANSVDARREYAEKTGVIFGDFNLLERAFLNVILNACDAMPSGGTLAVSALPASLDGRPAWTVRFADTGAGIAPDDLPKIFDPFFTRKEGGTGLGLAMTSRIVCAHDGKLSAANAPEGGAVFSFTLPVGPARGE